MKYQVKSTTVINAKLNKVKNIVKDFNTWKQWSPWSILEPGHKGLVKGKPGEVGHEMSWDGKAIGSGVNTLTGIERDSLIYDLVFITPFKSKAKVRFEFKEVKDGTKVTWLMDSSMPFFLFFMVKKMKAWIEMDYDRGLIMLKTIAEEGKIDAETTDEGIVDFDGFSYVGIKKTSELKDMPKEMSACFEELMTFLEQNGKQAKHWVSIYPKTNIVEKTFTYIAAMSDEGLGDMVLPDGWERGDVKSGKMYQIKHKGSYLYLGNAWSMGMMNMRANKCRGNGFPMEYYWNSPMNTEPSKLKTSIYFPVKG